MQFANNDLNANKRRENDWNANDLIGWLLVAELGKLE